MSIKRYCPHKDLPPYAYVPGLFPHPTKHPDGHSYVPPEAMPDEDFQGVIVSSTLPWYREDRWLWGVDLFNYRFFWESHECWEEQWKALPNTAPERCIFQAAIMTAASLLQLHLQRDRIAQKSWARAQELLEGAPSTLSLGWMQEDFWRDGPNWHQPPRIIVSEM